MTARRLCHGSVGHVPMTLGTWAPLGKCSGRPVQALSQVRRAGPGADDAGDLAELAALVEGERLVRRVQHGVKVWMVLSERDDVPASGLV
jgi:hypothetical protein